MINERDILSLLLTKGLGPKGVSRILCAVASQDGQIDLSLMSIAEMIQRIGVKPETAEQIPASIKKADELLKDLEDQGIKILVRGRAVYPERLLKTLKEDAPLVLFAKGNIKILSQKSVGFCGSRKASEKGLAVAGECAGALANRHINVISGYAHGVDLAAHRAALQAGGVTTFVLAEGILHFKIKSDVKDLLTENNHVVVSEYMPRLPWLARNAMQRNKTICGLSNAVVVIESGMQGGTFEAGKAALELKRPLFVAEYAQPAVSAEGNNYFLQKGARFLRKKNGAAYLDELFAAVEKDESNGTPPDTDPPVAQYKGEETEADVQQTLSVWESEKTYGEQAKAHTGDKGKVTYPKRLIEVDLPIKKISEFARREKKSAGHGHLTTLHIWWARRPLVACRAVICAALWPDPGDPNCPEMFKFEASRLMKSFRDTRGGRPYEWDNGLELRQALLDFIAEFSNMENSTNQDFIETSKKLTIKAHESLGGDTGTKPLVVDPFCGGGSIPLEAARIGADSFGSDLNPVATIISKVIMNYLPRFGKQMTGLLSVWGSRLRNEVIQEIGDLYPTHPDGAKPVAYIWARTIPCEGPNCGVTLPLIRSLWLQKKGSNKAALEILPNKEIGRVDFKVVMNPRTVSEGTVRRGSVTCPICGYTTPVSSVRKILTQQQGGAEKAQLVAVILSKENVTGRLFREPIESDHKAYKKSVEKSKDAEQKFINKYGYYPLREELPLMSGVFNAPIYGITTWRRLYSPRQFLMLLTFAEKISQINTDSEFQKLPFEVKSALITCLGLVHTKLADLANSLCNWEPNVPCVQHLFGRQAIQMSWDFAEGNILGTSRGSWLLCQKSLSKVFEANAEIWETGDIEMCDAANHVLPSESAAALITDPPYYNAVPYADLSDFFYVWLRISIKSAQETLMKRDLTPKDEEICEMAGWDNRRYKYKDALWFENKMKQALGEARRILSPKGIGVVVFAHKSTSGWEAMLQAMIDAGWIFTASWPIDTELETRLRGMNSAALASSIHLVCRPRENPDGSLRTDEIGDWRDVLAELPKRIHEWMPRLAKEGVVGADAIFACLGPALEIFSRYSSVEKASGEVVPLKEYLEHVWAAVAKEALNMIFEGAETTGFEEDARLTAMWLWTLSTGTTNGNGNGKERAGLKPAPTEDDETDDEDENSASSKTKLAGYTLEYDAARKIAQGLGAHLERLQSLVEVKGDKARLLPVAERTRALFGKDEATAPKAKKKKKEQLSMFAEIEEAEESGTWGDTPLSSPLSKGGFRGVGNTTLDRLHQAMILFAAGRGEALKRFLVEEGVGRDERFWRLAQAFSALYPKVTDEKRWVDGVLARKKGLGL